MPVLTGVLGTEGPIFCVIPLIMSKVYVFSRALEKRLLGSTDRLTDQVALEVFTKKDLIRPFEQQPFVQPLQQQSRLASFRCLRQRRRERRMRRMRRFASRVRKRSSCRP